MRHRVYGSHLSRNKDERTALFKNLVQSLFLHGSIQTTEKKAKAIKGLVDRIITQAKNKNHRLTIATFVNNKQALEKLTSEVLPGLSSRNSGYTSLIKVGQRKGDGAMMVKMSLLMEEKNSVKKGLKGLNKLKESKTKNKGKKGIETGQSIKKAKEPLSNP